MHTNNESNSKPSFKQGPISCHPQGCNFSIERLILCLTPPLMYLACLQAMGWHRQLTRLAVGSHCIGAYQALLSHLTCSSHPQLFFFCNSSFQRLLSTELNTAAIMQSTGSSPCWLQAVLLHLD